MLTIKQNQYQHLRDYKMTEFINLQIKNLRQKQKDNLGNKNDSQLSGIIGDIISWAKHYGIRKKKNIEYLINIFFKYSLSLEDLKKTKTVIEIFSYPSRKEDEKLFQLHYLLESTQHER